MGMTVKEMIGAILADMGVELDKGTVDTVKAGNPDQEVTGVLTAFTATFEVIREAAEAGLNVIITHEPTYYNHHDRLEEWQDDPVVREKRSLLEQYGLTVWRCHDALHCRKPDGIQEGMLDALGWTGYKTGPGEREVELPPVPLEQLASELKSALGLKHVRVTGRPGMLCRRIALELGAPGGERQLRHLREEAVDTVICGETAEWQVCEYARDASAIGLDKAVIMLGHAGSEAEGMRYMAERLRVLFPGLPVRYAAVADSFVCL
ncbi:MAG: NGG1p interacting factor [Paenibacillaceae bacterium]|jgi:putative NIF3 family GTP cyclohydrolase 1 type 2|nr:NGG1p interacting factor [Paenibacillaceae bacterium]